MYAVVKTGGKQYKVTENDVLRIEKIEAETGTIVTFDEVLLVANDNGVTVGTPMVSGASVAVEILAQKRARKIIIFKKRRRKSSRTKNGHRQHFTLIRISEILTNGAKPSKEPQGLPQKLSLAIVNDDVDGSSMNIVEETKKTKSKKASVNIDIATEEQAETKSKAKKSAVLKEEGSEEKAVKKTRAKKSDVSDTDSSAE